MTGWLVAAMVAWPGARAGAEVRYATDAGPGRPPVGVLVVAEHGTSQWDSAVRKTVKDAKLALPVEVVLGMGEGKNDLRRLQAAVTKLEQRGVPRLVVVPLVLTTASPGYRLLERAFGLATDPPGTDPAAGGPRLTLTVSVAMSPGLGSSPVLRYALYERALDMSHWPLEETVIFLAPGSPHDADDARQREELKAVVSSFEVNVRFKAMVVATWRHGAPREVQEPAIQAVKSEIRQGTQQGKVLLLPVVLAPGGPERLLPKLFPGASYETDRKGILPHRVASQWIADEIDRLAAP
jgi:hypothetical protein